MKSQSANDCSVSTGCGWTTPDQSYVGENMHVTMYVRMHAFMYDLMYVYIYIYIERQGVPSALVGSVALNVAFGLHRVSNIVKNPVK